MPIPDVRTAAPRDVAQALSAEFASRADAADRAMCLPAEDVAALKASGILMANVPREYGGLGLPLREVVALQLELAQGSASTGIVAAMSLQVVGRERDRELRNGVAMRRIGDIMTSGGLINSIASEPALGSPSRGGAFATRCAAQPDGTLRLDGCKTWSTGGRHLTHLFVRAMLGDEQCVVVVENNQPGIRWQETWQHSLALRASDSHDVYFEGVCVAPEDIIEQGDQPKSYNAWFPMLLAATYLGAAMAARSAVIQYALERVPTALGKPIATLPKIQRQIGEIDMQLQAAESLLLDATAPWTDDRHDDFGALFPRIVAAKQFAVGVANTVTDRALQVAGGIALTSSSPLERFFRDTRPGNMQPPSGDTAFEIIGRDAIARHQARSDDD